MLDMLQPKATAISHHNMHHDNLALGLFDCDLTDGLLSLYCIVESGIYMDSFYLFCNTVHFISKLLGNKFTEILSIVGETVSTYC